MKENHGLTVEEMASEESFQAYVLKLNSKDEAYWKEWIAKNPEYYELVSQAEEMVLSTSDFTNQYFNDQFLAFNQKINTSGKKKSRRLITLYKKDFFTKIAAVFFLGLAGLWVLNFYLDFLNLSKNTVATKPEFIEKICPPGHKLTLFLSDGSKIKLNGASKLKFPKTFSDNTRLVELEGEAFFEVTKNTERPFVIKSGKFKTKVLGTSFNVNAFPQKGDVSVAVLTGKVQVSKPETNKKVLLIANEAMIFEKENFIKIPFNEEKLIGWRNDIIVFENADLNEIKERLSRWYGVSFDIQLKEKISKGYSGKFKNQSIENIMRGISFSLDFEYKIENKKVTIY